MKQAIIILALLTGCATNTGIKMTDEEKAACQAVGCTVWTEGELHMFAQKFFRDGWNAGAKAAGKAI